MQAALQRSQRVSAPEVRQAHQKLQISLQGDRQRRVREAGEAIETLLSEYQKKESWERISIWYRQASGQQDGRPNRRGSTWIVSRRRERRSTGSDHLRGYDWPSW